MQPMAQTLYEVIEATWPAARTLRVGNWTIRDGQGGGSRVSSATLAVGQASASDIAEAESAMAALGQPKLFMIRDGDDALDTALEGLGYVIKDPVTLYAARLSDIAKPDVPTANAYDIWPPLAVQLEIWEEGGIGPARIQVMERSESVKTSLFGRIEDHPAATGYVAIHQDVAMLHALETKPEHRRKGLARYMVYAMAQWAQTQGAAFLSLVTTRENLPANALYASMGFQPVGQYHYRIHPEAS